MANRKCIDIGWVRLCALSGVGMANVFAKCRRNHRRHASIASKRQKRFDVDFSFIFSARENHWIVLAWIRTCDAQFFHRVFHLASDNMKLKRAIIIWLFDHMASPTEPSSDRLRIKQNTFISSNHRINENRWVKLYRLYIYLPEFWIVSMIKMPVSHSHSSHYGGFLALHYYVYVKVKFNIKHKNVLRLSRSL